MISGMTLYSIPVSSCYFSCKNKDTSLNLNKSDAISIGVQNYSENIFLLL